MPYMPPFVVPAQPQVIRQGFQISPRPPRYYGSDEADLSALADAPTMALIEQYAPSVAKLVAGLTPEEQVELLNAKIQNLQKYTKLPVVGNFAQDKIVEYSARVKALQPVVRAERLKRNIILVGLTMAGLVGFSVAFYYFNKGLREIKETD